MKSWKAAIMGLFAATSASAGESVTILGGNPSQNNIDKILDANRTNKKNLEIDGRAVVLDWFNAGSGCEVVSAYPAPKIPEKPRGEPLARLHVCNEEADLPPRLPPSPDTPTM